MQLFNRRILAGETKADWARRFYEAAQASGTVYRNEGVGLTLITPKSGPRRFLTADEFAGALHSVVEVVDVKEGRGGETYTSSVFLQRPEVQALWEYHQESSLPILRAAVDEPVVLPRGPGAFQVTEVGFNARGGHNVYYYVPPLQTAIQPLNSTRRLVECFSGVPFERVEHRNNLLAWLLGAVVLDPQMDPPFLVVSGNQQGIGKSACVQAAGYILNGSVPPPIDFREGEMMKNISSRFLENDRMMFLDNIVTNKNKGFDNSQLSTLLTQGFSKKIRILGQSKTVSASGILFAASVNDARLSADLATRSLAVKLYKEITGPMTPFCRDYAMEHRRELYGELLGLALRSPPPAKGGDHRSFRFRRWLEFVQPRIEAAFGPLALDEVVNLDEATQELFHWGADHGDAAFTAGDFVQAISMRRDVFPGLAERILGKPSAVGRAIAAGYFLKARLGQLFQLGDSCLKLVVRTESTEAREFAFEKEAPSA